MPWILIDVLIGVLAVVVFGVVAFALYRHTRRLIASVSTASSRVGAAMPPSPAPRA